MFFNDILIVIFLIWLTIFGIESIEVIILLEQFIICWHQFNLLLVGIVIRIFLISGNVIVIFLTPTI